MIFHEQPTDPWLPFDFKLLEAYQILEDETCPLCHKPIWICRSVNPKLMFKVREAVCFADRELKANEHERAKKNGTKTSENSIKQEFGKYRYTEAYMVDGSPLPTRDEYLSAVE